MKTFNMVKTINLALVLVAAITFSGMSFGTALQSPITVGGVVWNPHVGSDFQAQSFINLSNLDNNILSGIGKIGAINTDSSGFCPGCELTFSFSYDVVTTSGPDALFNNGIVNFYVDNNPDFNVNDTSSATDGLLWLSTEGHAVLGNLGVGDLFATLTSGGGYTGSATGNSSGLLDAVGGAAFANFDTNGQSDEADFAFSASFQPTYDSLATYPFFGTAEFSGTSVPSPAPLALVGLGLLGLYFGSKRKTS